MNVLAFRCPPGISPKKWARWSMIQRRNALRIYWQALPYRTRLMLQQKHAGKHS